MLNLLYVSLKALANKKIPDTLVKCIFELRMIALNGECPEVFACKNCGGTQDLDTYSMTADGIYCPCVSRTGAGRHTVRRIYRIHAPVYCHGTA